MSPQPARLTFRKTPNARLYIEAGKNWRFLKTKLPKKAFASITLSTSWHSLIGYAALSVIFILGTVLFGPKLFGYASHMIPQSTEEQIGQLVIESAINNSVCVAPQGRASLEKMVQNLQQGMKRNIAFNVHVVSDDETLNALAAPGGHLVIYSGILNQADSADEVAGVLAHEMAHIEMNHPMKSVMRNLGFSLILQMMFGDTGTLSNTAKLAGIFNQLHYSRQDEFEADKVGQYLLRKASINPAGLGLFLERLQQVEAERIESGEPDFPKFQAYFSTHPHTQTRIDHLKTNEISATDHKEILSEIEWQALKNICAEISLLKD